MNILKSTARHGKPNYIWRIVDKLELLDQSGLVNNQFQIKNLNMLCLQHSWSGVVEYEIISDKYKEELSEPDNVEILRLFEEI